VKQIQFLCIKGQYLNMPLHEQKTLHLNTSKQQWKFNPQNDDYHKNNLYIFKTYSKINYA
jgi:hypothetical protein